MAFFDFLHIFTDLFDSVAKAWNKLEPKVQDALVKADQPEGRGTMPDYEVWPTFNDFMQNRDTQMEFVLKLINEHK